MVPKTEIKFSFIYNKNLNQNIILKEFLELKKKSYPFKELVAKYIDEILRLIAFYNEPWKKEYIPIYIIFGKVKSFSDPLTLKYQEDNKLLLFILIHELIHNNLTKKYKDTKSLHKEIDKIYQKVICDLKLQDFEEAKKKYNEKYNAEGNFHHSLNGGLRE